MWAYGHHFCTKYADEGHITQDCGVEVEFDQSSRASHRDENLIEEVRLHWKDTRDHASGLLIILMCLFLLQVVGYLQPEKCKGRS
jgi:hypothetical protein